MKKVLMLVISSIILFGCNEVKDDSVDKKVSIDEDDFYVIRNTDPMTDSVYYYVSYPIVATNEELTRGFIITPLIDDSLSFKTIMVKTYDIGECNSDNEMIILFYDGTKITKKSYNDTRCDGVMYFDFNNDDIKLLEVKKISRVRITNGLSGDRYTNILEEKFANYFPIIIKTIKLKKFTNLNI